MALYERAFNDPTNNGTHVQLTSPHSFPNSAPRCEASGTLCCSRSGSRAGGGGNYMGHPSHWHMRGKGSFMGYSSHWHMTGRSPIDPLPFLMVANPCVHSHPSCPFSGSGTSASEYPSSSRWGSMLSHQSHPCSFHSLAGYRFRSAQWTEPHGPL